MCGLLGVLNGDRCEGHWGQTYRIMGALFRASESRGRHATGFAAITEPLDRPHRQKIIIAKEPLPAREFIEKNGPWRGLRTRRCSAIIAHVRYATHGDPMKNENNHPHSTEHLSLVHNGILPDHRELTDKYCVRLTTDCDSEVLLRIIEKASSIPVGLSLCLRERPGAIAVLDHRRDVVWLGRDSSRPLWVCRLRKDRRLFFASTSGILLAALTQEFGKMEAMAKVEELIPLAPYHVYSASPNGSLIAAFEDEVRPNKTRLWTEGGEGGTPAARRCDEGV